MNSEIVLQVLIRTSVLSLAAWLVVLALRRASGARRAAVAACGLAACVLIPALVPLTRGEPQGSEPAVMPVAAPVVEPVVQAAAGEVPEMAVQNASAEIPWDALALTGFALVAGLLAMRVGFGVVLAARISRRSRPDTVLGHPVRISRDSVSPMTVMVRTVVLPAEVITWPEDRLRPILEHELAHARRLDAVSVAASSLICALLWPVLPVWLLRRELIRAIEDAADDQVIARHIDPLTYAETLRIACAAFRSGPAEVPTFVRKTMIFSRIERTLKPAVDRSRVAPLGLAALAVLALAASAASAYSVLRAEPVPVLASPKPKIAVEIVQLQTMDAKPVYWKPDGTRIPADKAIANAHGMKANPGDVVVWTRTRDPKKTGILWITNAGKFNTNSGYSFFKDGWLYASSRIFSGGKKLPATSPMRAQVAVGEYDSLGDYLTADMIAKGSGRTTPVKVGDNYMVSGWGIKPFIWTKWEKGRRAGQLPPQDSFYVDFKIRRSTLTGSSGFHYELMDKEHNSESTIEYLSLGEGEYAEARFWLKARPEDIKRLWVVVRNCQHPEFKNIALRPKN